MIRSRPGWFGCAHHGFGNPGRVVIELPSNICVVRENFLDADFRRYKVVLHFLQSIRGSPLAPLQSPPRRGEACPPPVERGELEGGAIRVQGASAPFGCSAWGFSPRQLAFRQPVSPELKLRAERPKPAEAGCRSIRAATFSVLQRPSAAQPGGLAPGNPSRFVVISSRPLTVIPPRQAAKDTRKPLLEARSRGQDISPLSPQDKP